MRFHRYLALLIPLLLLTGIISPAVAQDFNPGDAVSISGKVISFGSESLTLEVGDFQAGNTQQQTFPLPPAYTVVDQDGNNVALEAGMMVKVEGVIGDDGNPQFSRIVVDANQPGDQPQGEQFGGIVRANNGSSLELEGFDDASQTTYLFNVTLGSGAQVLDQNNNPISLSDIPVGNLAGGLGEKQSDGSFVASIIIDNGPADPGDQPGDGHKFGGTVSAVTGTTFDVSWERPDEGTSGTDTYLYDSTTEIVDENGASITLAVGDFVEGDAEVLSDGSLKAIKVVKYSQSGGHQPGERFQSGGMVLEVGTDYIVVSWTNDQTGESGTDKLFLTAETPITDDQGNPATVEVGVSVGGEVEVAEDGSLVLLNLVVFPGSGGAPGDTVDFGGQVVAFGSDFVEVEGTKEDGTVITITGTIDENTMIVAEDGTHTVLSDSVFVEGKGIMQEGDAILVLKLVVHPSGLKPDFVGGQVTQAGSDFLLVFFTDRESGDTGTVKVLYGNETQVLDVDSSEIAFSEIKVGNQVYATGKVTALGELQAETISRLPGKPAADINFSGEIVRVYSDQVFVKGVSPTGVTYFLRVLVDGDVTLTDAAGNPASLSDFHVGDAVHGQGGLTSDFAVATELLSLGSGDNITAGQKVPFSGIITEVGSDYFVSEYGHPALTKRNTLTSETVIRTASGASSGLAAGDFFSAMSEIAEDGSIKVLEVRTYDGNVEIPGVDVPLDGQITEVGSEYLLVQDQREGEVKVLVLKNTQDANGNPVKATDFSSGEAFAGRAVMQACLLAVLSDAPAGAEKIDFAGTIISVGESSFDVLTEDPDGNSTTLTIVVGPETRITDLLGTELTIQGLAKGNYIIATAQVGDGGVITGLFIQLELNPEFPGNIGGRIVTVGDGSLDIEVSMSDENRLDTLRVIVDENTIYEDVTGAAIGFADLRAGDEVEADLSQSADGSMLVTRLKRLQGQQAPGDTVELGGTIISVGENSIEFEYTDPESGETRTAQGVFIEGATIVGSDGNPATPKAGLTFTGKGVIYSDRGLEILSIKLNPATSGKPVPGEAVEVEGTITEISGTRVNLKIDDPSSPVPSAWMDVPSGTTITTSTGLTVQFGWLTAGDVLYAEGVVNADSISLTANKVEYVSGSLRLLSGKVASVGSGKFEMEARNAAGKSIIAQVSVGSGTSIVRKLTGERLTIADIISGTTVTTVARLVSGTSYTGIQVIVPAPERILVEGRVLELLADGFAMELKDNQNTYRARVYTSQATVWLAESGDSHVSASASDLTAGDLVKISGARTGPLSAKADTVIIRDTGALTVRTFTILNGKVASSKLTFRVDLNEGTGSPSLDGTGSLTVTPDYSNLSGSLDMSAAGGGINPVKLVKVSGTSGVLTGFWSGYMDSSTDGQLQASAELFQSGTSVVGEIKIGGQAETGTDSIPKAGDEVSIIGQVTSVGANGLVVTYTNELNQRVDKPVIVHSGTKYVDINHKSMSISLDSLLSREVDVFGILQSNLSIVANEIEVYPLAGEGNISLNMPVLSSLSWNSSSHALRFAVGGDLLDNIASGGVTFSGQTASDGNSFSLSATLGADVLSFSARRLSGDDGISGEWSGSISLQVSDRTKLWPAFLSVVESDGSYAGNYEIGQSRFKSAVTTRNNAPVFQQVEEVEVQEQQPVSIQVSATDSDGDPITLSVTGVPLSGSSFTDNGDGTGTYNLTVPTLSAGKNELFVNFQADDGKGGVSSMMVEIEVTKTNRVPEIGSFPDTLRLTAGKKLQVSIPVRDEEGGELEYEFDGLPTWARVSGGQVTFEPPYGSAGAYSFTVKVEDDQDGEASKTFYFKVTAANRAPRLATIEPIAVQAGELVSFTVQASDPDAGDVVTLAAAAAGGVTALPSGSSFNSATGAFTWTPAQEQLGPFKAGFTATDSKGAKVSMTVNIFVGQGAAPPTIDVPDTVRAAQGESASFTATGQSSSGGEVEFLARNLPPGSNWSTAGDSLEWYPSYDQQGEFVITMSASDGSFRTDKDVVIMVNPVLQVATLKDLDDYTVAENQLLRFQVDGTYPDGSRVVFSPLAAPPANSSFDPLTGSFRFLPDYTQAGSYNLTFSATMADGTVISVQNTVTVTNKNRKPKIADLPNLNIDLGTSVAFEIIATDPDAGDALTYTADNLPGDARFETTSNPPAFLWLTPTEGVHEISFNVSDPGGLTDRATVAITVGDQNQPPVLGSLADLKIAEGDTLILVVSASDPEGDPVSVFVSPLPSNASFDNDSKTFTFQPSHTQAGIYNLRFVASDGELTDESRISVTVSDVALPPRITVPANWTVEEGDELRFTVSVRDVSGNRRSVFSSDLPAGAELESETGQFHWTPAFHQAGEYQVTFNTSDGSQTASANAKIVVTDKNQPPSLFRVDHQEVPEGELIAFEISVFDPDGDEVTIQIDSSGTPYMNSAEIRNSNVFVFNTALLDPADQIPSAVFRVTADDGRGGADTMRVDFRIIRSEDVNVPDVPPGGDGFQHGFSGTGLTFTMQNNGSNAVGGQITGREVSGELNPGSTGGTLLAGDLNSKYPQLERSKDKVTVRPFLSGDGTTSGDFYSVRRGWGLDLSSNLLGSLTSLQFDLTFSYQDRDIPATDIPEFQESAISIFGLDATGNFVQIPTQLDTAANTATAPADLSLYTDFTLGVILDLAAPVISYTSKLLSTPNEAGPYSVITTIVDNALIRNARLYYSTDGENYNSVALKPDSVMINGFTGDIPGHAEGATLYYYIEASDEEHTVTDPPDAPQSAYQFSILLDGITGAGSGDSNGDGKIDIFDLLDILSILGGKKSPSAGSDVDGNGRVDIFDLLALLGKL